jgi:hypothetical protein
VLGSGTQAGQLGFEYSEAPVRTRHLGRRVSEGLLRLGKPTTEGERFRLQPRELSRDARRLLSLVLDVRGAGSGWEHDGREHHKQQRGAPTELRHGVVV